MMTAEFEDLEPGAEGAGVRGVIDVQALARHVVVGFSSCRSTRTVADCGSKLTFTG